MDVGNLGCALAVRRVEFAMEQRREGRSGLKPVAVFVDREADSLSGRQS